MITANDLCNTAMIAIYEGWGYIWGKWGQVWTAQEQKNATRDMTVKYGAKWIGKRVCDCSGLFYWMFWLFGMADKMDHGSNSIWKQRCIHKGKLKNGIPTDGHELKPGTAMFLYRSSDNNRHHIGLYIGNGRVIECKGTINGTVMSAPSHWDEWGELQNVDYSGEVTIMAECLRLGCQGEAVGQLQEDLNTLGYNCGKVDKKFGRNTQEAVKDFQVDNGLKVDGIAGEKTLYEIDEKMGRHHDTPVVDDDVVKMLSNTMAKLNECVAELEIIKDKLKRE